MYVTSYFLCIMSSSERIRRRRIVDFDDENVVDDDECQIDEEGDDGDDGLSDFDLLNEEEDISNGNVSSPRRKLPPLDKVLGKAAVRESPWKKYNNEIQSASVKNIDSNVSVPQNTRLLEQVL